MSRADRSCAAAIGEPFEEWFSSRKWAVRPHQREMVRRSGESALLLVAPTGGGKTLAGFLPSLAEIPLRQSAGLHTLYVSPLKALAADIKRNLLVPISEMDLPIRVEDRTGDTSHAARLRQRADPPHILLTTPESLTLLLSYPDAARMFGGLSRVIVDEIHALAESKRGDQLMLGMSRLQAISPNLRRVGLSATVRDPKEMAGYLAGRAMACGILAAEPGPPPDIRMLEADEAPPWSGGGGRYGVRAVLDALRNARLTLIFINTRAQAELFFRALWQENDGALPIGIHHGSLSLDARKRVEQAMVDGLLRAVVCTGTLDLGIDWGDVDLVIQVGTPKNVKRLVQRIGRSNHRYNAPSRALVLPANQFETIECTAALDAVRDEDLDGEPKRKAPLDVLCQHIMVAACSGPFDADDLFREVRSAGPYGRLSRADFDDCLQFCATGGYALRAYDRWRRLMQDGSGKWRLRDPRTARAIRMNTGTIVGTEMLGVRLGKRRGGRMLGEVEEFFAATLKPGDSFLIGGETVRYERISEMCVQVSREGSGRPKIAVFKGTKFSTSTLLCDRVLRILESGDWSGLPKRVAEWLDAQRAISKIPRQDRLLVESFRHGGREYTCVYAFAGYNAQQTLGMLLTERMEEAGLGPLGLVSNDYAVLIWSLDPAADPEALLCGRPIRDVLETWLAGNALMKRTFRGVATIAGLIDRSFPGKRKSSRQVTFSTDILFDTLHKHDPDHVLLRATREEAMKGLIDFGRIEEMLERIGGRIDHVRAPHLTPLAAPLLLEVGSIPIKGSGEDRLIAEEAEAWIRKAGLIGKPAATRPAA